MLDAIFLKVIRLASVADLREVAAMLQDRGDLDASEDLDWIACHKGRGDLPELLGDGSGAAKAMLKTKEANCMNIKK